MSNVGLSTVAVTLSAPNSFLSPFIGKRTDVLNLRWSMLDAGCWIFKALSLLVLTLWTPPPLAYSAPVESIIFDDAPLDLPVVGAHQLRILSPTVLELTLITTKPPDPARVAQWDFVDRSGNPRLPSKDQFIALADGKTNSISTVGFKRRVLYAPLKTRDLRIANSLYLQLARPISDNETIEVRNPDGKLWSSEVHFVAKADPLRWSPVLHVDQVGYTPSSPKTAMAGYYLGSMGELNIPPAPSGTNATTTPAGVDFKIIEVASGKEVYQGRFSRRPDHGFPFDCYQRVLEADFSNLKQPGEYRLKVSGVGVSFPFVIDDGVAAALARTYALGIYHQRCGTDNELPFTRFTHGPCHVAPAEVPTMTSRYDQVNDVLKGETEDAKENPRHKAPPLKNVSASLYPFVNRGPIDVRGGHHDAGDYSKYTANSATFIHLLVFAADNFPGVRDLDNLGIPESCDGKSDILQEAKWEADFLAKMQDADGGFYFLVYPRDRRYEDDVTPDRGDPQVVFPKTTSVTAAATAALAQCASSPTFKQQFPEAAALYLEKAKKGWQFLERALAEHGKDGAYQKITHYADYAMHDDELAWAACEMFLATGDPAFEAKLMEWLDPSNSENRKWGWWRLFESYGHAIRSYAFAARSGRLKREQLSAPFLEKCESEIAAAGDDQLRRAEDSAYGTSFPADTKRSRSAGWYFSADAAFDLATACQINYPVMNDPRSKMYKAILSNLHYALGCNPVNVSYLTGIGWKRQREIVHQYAQNDRRVLPPSGIPLGDIQDGFGWLEPYKKELGELSFPADGDNISPYPMYDRWGDSFNLSQEFVICNQARALACTAWLMAQTPLKTQKWKSAAAQINVSSARDKAGNTIGLELSAPGLDLSRARIVWEARGQEPAFGTHYKLPTPPGDGCWIEAEAQLFDGRRVFGVTNLPLHTRTEAHNNTHP
jgi:hypothetical protein